MLLKSRKTTSSLTKVVTFRQGDVLVQRVDAIPEGANPVKFKDRVILQHGEVTGHCHAISTQYAKMFTNKGQRYIAVEPGARLVHEEHGVIELPQGFYRVVQQREYVPEAPPRDVID
jgi:hypothetical protein